MRFYQEGQEVVWKLGRMFIRGKAVDVTDPFTIGVLSRDPLFKEYHEETQRQETKTDAVLKNQCTKCGRVIPRGWYMHQKHCKGSK